MGCLDTAKSTQCTTVTIATDCLSFLRKILEWTRWDSHTENDIMREINELIRSGKKVTCRYVKSHSGNAWNEAVDQLIRDVWTEKKDILKTATEPTPKTKEEVKNTIKQRMEEDETSTRTTLRVTQDSKSSRNIYQLQLTSAKI